MHRFSKKTTLVAAGAAVLVVIGGGVAYAYWTAGGTGSGSAETGTSADIKVNQVTKVNPMGPGIAAQTLSGSFTNATAGPVFVTTVTASIANVFKGDGVAVGCSAADYNLADAVMKVGAQVAVGADVGAWKGATIDFNNTAANQDACKNAVVSLRYVVS